MIAAAPRREDRVVASAFLASITDPSNTYFERAFRALGVTEAAYAQSKPSKVTSDFIALMRITAQSGSVGDMLAVLVVCQWSFKSIAEAAHASRAKGECHRRRSLLGN